LRPGGGAVARDGTQTIQRQVLKGEVPDAEPSNLLKPV
jgi:hypothetical protein